MSSNRVLWTIGAAIVLLAAGALWVLISITQQAAAVRRSQAHVQYTREVTARLQDLFSSLQDAETGERGYVITGREEFLEPYDRARATLGADLHRLDSLISDPEAQRTLDELTALAQRHIILLGNVVELRRSGDVHGATTLVRQQTGKQLMDHGRALVERLKSQHQALLAERLAVFERASARSERMVQLALSSTIVLVLLGGAFLGRDAYRRLTAERKAATAAALLRSTLDSIGQGVVVVDPLRRVIAWNRRYLELRGIESGAMHLDMSVEDMLRAASPATFAAGVEQLDQGEMARSLEDLTRTFDGEAVTASGQTLEICGRPVASGNYIETITDVTALKRSEAAYRDQATRLTAILDNAVDAVITINESGSIESWSKSAERLFGYTAEEVLRRNVNLLMNEPHATAHDGYLRHYIETGEKRIMGGRREVQASHRDGRELQVDLGISELLLGSRRLFIGIVRDISERLEIERMKSGFVSTVSHELRTPLTSIAGSLGLLAGGAAGELSGKAARLIEIDRLNSERLILLINDILDLEKAESGKLELSPALYSLKDLVQHAIELNHAFAQTFAVSIELEPHSADPTVLVDRDRLTQVMTNLLSNAAKFSPRDGTVQVSIEELGREVRVCVRDHGSGIPPGFEARLFRRFAQADSSDARRKGGTGLGLSICKTLIERSGGRIGFERPQDGGALFYFVLPAMPKPAVPHEVQSPAAGRVLVCDDDPDVAQFLADSLGQYGMRAVVAINAQAARAAFSQHEFDLALIDINLPDEDGFQLISELRASDDTRELPVIVITASSQRFREAQAQALSLAGWLQKPIEPHRLIETVQRALFSAAVD
jgi:PAS domain S-box-containing protein